MNKIILLFALFLMLCNAKTEAQFGGGGGSQSNPYIINHINHINELSDSMIFGEKVGTRN